MNSKEKYKFKKFIKDLSLVRGRHTELVSVYIPADYDLNKIINHIAQEQGTASNIKDKTTRTHVIDSLEKIIRHLRLFKKTPKNGLAVFAGDISKKQGQTDIEVFSVEPPKPLKLRLYRCDQQFVLEPLIDIVEEKAIYGLVVMDRREGDVGILKGTNIQEITHLTSGVPGKTRAGGQCHIFGTLIQSTSGSILKIEDTHNPIILKSMMMDNYSIKDSPITDKWTTKKPEIYKIKTKHPQLIVESSKDHIFFVVTDKGIVEKSAKELKVGDYLLTPEKIEIKGENQTLDSKQFYNAFIIKKEGINLLKRKRLEKKLLQRQLAKKIGVTQTTTSRTELGKININRIFLKKLCKELNIHFKNFLKNHTKPYKKYGNINLPEKLDIKFAQFLGYFVGDGYIEKDRITFFEQNKELALVYKKQFNEYFNIKSNYKFRESKNYHQLRFTSRPLVRLIKKEFPEITNSTESLIPSKILKSKNKVVAAFLRGLFDAEGYISRNRVGLGINNKLLTQQIQLALLRFGILSSFSVYDNKKNPYSNRTRYSICISDRQSLKFFQKEIGFTYSKKRNKLKLSLKTLSKKQYKSFTRQIIPAGTEIRKILEKEGYVIHRDFLSANMFLQGKRKISKQAFKTSILNKIKNKELKNRLNKILQYELIPVKIKDIQISKKPTNMIDISVKNQNFIANGLIVHNSAKRFESLREIAAKEFYKRIGNAVNKEFLNKKDLKGIIVGGPGQTKQEFVDGDFINNQLKGKVLGMFDLSYTGEFGLQELVDKSKDLLAKEEVMQEKQLMERFFTLLSKEPNKVAYGITGIKKALQLGAIDTLLISESIEDEITQQLEEEAEKTSTNVQIISIESREGIQLKELGGIAAILRFPIS